MRGRPDTSRQVPVEIPGEVLGRAVSRHLFLFFVVVVVVPKNDVSLVGQFNYIYN
jgi:hypothetical protein